MHMLAVLIEPPVVCGELDDSVGLAVGDAKAL